MLTQERLRIFLDYNPVTGIFKHRRGRSGCRPGQIAGAITVQGYRTINVDGERFRAARLAWLYMTGTWPADHVDHIDGCPENDRWENLRAATRSENMRNTKLRINNSSGSRGVSWHKYRQQWHVRVTMHGRVHHVGYFDDFEKAKSARDTRANELHGAFAKFDSLQPERKELT